MTAAPRHRLHASSPHMGDDKLSGDEALRVLDLSTQLVLAERERAANLAAALDTCRQSEAVLKSRLAETVADLKMARLEASRLRGAFSSPPPSPPASSDWLSTSSMQARVQAAVQATLRAERWQHTQRLACPVCLEREKDCALSCGHTFCGPCAWRLASCALCRGDIQARIHLY